MKVVAKLDQPLLLVTGALLMYGLLILYSAGQTDVPSFVQFAWQRQLVWLVVGVAGAALALRLSPRVLEWFAPAVYAVAIAVLALTLVIGTGAGTASSTRSWIALGGVRLGQPAEFAKLATILMLARYLSSQRAPAGSLRELLVPCIIAAVPAGLVFLQPDLGSALVFAGILFATLYWAGTPVRLLVLLASPVISLVLAFDKWVWGAWLLLLCGLLFLWRPYVWEGLTVALVSLVTGNAARPMWQGLAEYQQNRLISFLNPDADPRATGWHIIQSKIAIGSGGWLGKGFTQGSQKRLAFLPEQHTDFIFPVVGEELGFIGVVVALGLFMFLLATIIRIARSSQDPFSSLLAFGVAGLLATHIFQSIGMSANVMPITGIPLPFFSYGGSFLVTCVVATGLCLRVAVDARELGYRDM
jgi:rod shape determining protein RodA